MTSKTYYSESALRRALKANEGRVLEPDELRRILALVDNLVGDLRGLRT